MNKLLLGALLVATVPSAANAAVLLSEDFESGSGAFTLSGNAALANGATYNPCCGTPNDTSNTFVAFGGGNLPSALASASFNTVDSIVDNISIAGAIPEPATWALFILGFGMIGGSLRRSKPARAAMHFA